MITAQELKDEYDRALKKLQARCKHKKTTRCLSEWAPAHYTGEVDVCDRCWKRVKEYPLEMPKFEVKP